MNAFYCRLKNPELQNKYLGHAIDTQQLKIPDQNSPDGKTSVILIGVGWYEVDEEGTPGLSSEAAPSYVPAEELQFLGLVDDYTIEEILEQYYDANFEELEEDENQLDLTSQTTAPTTPPNQVEATQ